MIRTLDSAARATLASFIPIYVNPQCREERHGLRPWRFGIQVRAAEDLSVGHYWFDYGFQCFAFRLAYLIQMQVLGLRRVQQTDVGHDGADR